MLFILILHYIAAAAVGYLLGNLSFSNMMSQHLAEKDIRTVGSGNAGAANLLRTFGLKYAIPVCLGDACKAIAGALLGCLIIGKGFEGFTWLGGFSAPEIYVGGVAAILGHNFPVFMHFRGGKGVASSLGLLIIMNPLMGAGFILFAAIANTFIRLYSLVSISTMLLATILYTVFDAHGDWIEVGVLLFLLVLMIFMHRSNLARLFKGEEKKMDIEMDKTK